MTSLPPPEQWVLSKMNEMEVAEMIEEHIDYYTEDEDGNRRSVHLPTPFVRHFMRRHDGALPTVVAIATAPIVLADGVLLAPDGLDRAARHPVHHPGRAAGGHPASARTARRSGEGGDGVPVRRVAGRRRHRLRRQGDHHCRRAHPDRALAVTGPAVLLRHRRAARRGKTTTLTMLIMAVTGLWPAAAAWSTNEEERRKALMSYFLYGVPYILWDNIARGTQISCPHIEKSCTAAYYSDRKLGVSEMVCTAASTIHLFTGNNIGPRGRPGLAQPAYPPRRGPRRPREPAVQAPGPDRLDREPPRRDPGGALHHPAW